jgi:hypothetical protein
MLYQFLHMAKAKRNPPWWLEEGTETCSTCSHTYVYQTEYRCVACDIPLCGDCVQLITVEVFCPGCVEADVRDAR